MSNYKFNQEKIENLKNNSESTSVVSTISYEVENAMAKGVSKNKIGAKLNDLKDAGNFPTNLNYIDSFYDPETSSSDIAFLDNNTGNVLIGFDRALWGNIT